MTVTDWYTPLPRMARSMYWHGAAVLPTTHSVGRYGGDWPTLVEDTSGLANDSSARVAYDADSGLYEIAQTLHMIPLRAAWDVTYTYGSGAGAMPEYPVPQDPADPVVLDPGPSLPAPYTAWVFEQAGPSAGALTTPTVAKAYLEPKTTRSDFVTGELNIQGIESISIYELPDTSPYHPDNFAGGFLGFVPRSVLLTMTPLWQGVPTNDVTTVEVDLTEPAASTDIASVLTVPTAMLSTTPPPSGDWVEALLSRAEVEVEYQGPRYRYAYPGSMQLRRRQQQSAAGLAPRRRQITSRIGSPRRGPGAAP